MVRSPDLQIDGWRLEDGESRHRETPSSFWIPDLAIRTSLYPGDFAKLIFSIAVDDLEQSLEVERMWVIVRERTSFGYLGVLDNDPKCIAENDSLWSGAELPFEARHIIDVDHANEDSVRIAADRPAKLWK
jgi:hypothetical protein